MINHKVLSILLFSFIALQAGDSQNIQSNAACALRVLPALLNVAQSSKSSDHKVFGHFDNSYEKRKFFHKMSEEAKEASAGALVESAEQYTRMIKQEPRLQKKHTNQIPKYFHKQDSRNGNGAPVRRKEKGQKTSTRNQSKQSRKGGSTFTQYMRSSNTAHK